MFPRLVWSFRVLVASGPTATVDGRLGSGTLSSGHFSPMLKTSRKPLLRCELSYWRKPPMALSQISLLVIAPRLIDHSCQLALTSYGKTIKEILTLRFSSGPIRDLRSGMNGGWQIVATGNLRGMATGMDYSSGEAIVVPVIPMVGAGF